MKFANVAVVGLVVLGVFGLVFACQTFSSIGLVESAEDISIGRSCSGGDYHTLWEPSACMDQQEVRYEGTGSVPVKNNAGEVITSVEGKVCRTGSRNKCDAQDQFVAQGSEGSVDDVHVSCGTYFPTTGAAPEGIIVRPYLDDNGNLLGHYDEPAVCESMTAFIAEDCETRQDVDDDGC